MIAKLYALKNHSGFIRYFKNTGWMMAEKLLRIVAGLFVGIWVARYLGPDQFGLFSYVLAFTAIFGGIAKLGLDGIMVRELVDQPERHKMYLGTAFWLKVIGAIAVMALMAAILPFTTNDSTINLFVFIIAAGLMFQSFEVIEFYFHSQVLAKIVSICKAIQLILSSAIKIFLVLIEADLIWFVFVVALDAVSLAVSYYFAYKVAGKPSFYKYFDLGLSKKLLKASLPLTLSTVVVMIYMRIDQVMIKEIMGQHEVGIYSSAIKLSEAFYFMPTLVAASLFPAILNAKKICRDLYMVRLQRLYTLMTWAAVAIAIPVSLLSEWIVNLLYGEAYRDAARILMVHVWSLPFVFLLVVSGKWFISEGLEFKAFERNLIAMLLNVLLNFVLIPVYGAMGAAISTLVAFAVSSYLYDLISAATREQFYLKSKAILFKGLS
jgi:O-antigen/teichoic acid export membrane protein